MAELLMNSAIARLGTLGSNVDHFADRTISTGDNLYFNRGCNTIPVDTPSGRER